MDIYRAHVLVCGGTGCSSSGSAKLIECFEQKIGEYGLEKEVKVIRTGCFGLCEAGPVVIVYPDGTFYSRVKPENVDEIQKRQLAHVTVSQTGCVGMCRLEPMVDVIVPGKEKVTYVHVKPDMVPRIVAEHIVNGRPVQEYTIGAAENA